MNSEWAAERLETIRTLMERSALYRRALSPVMLTVGGIGIVSWLMGRYLPATLETTGWPAWWMGTALLSLAAAALMVRRQALGQQEPFWTPPTRQIARSMAPAMVSGAVLGVALLLSPSPAPISWLPLAWGLCYGIALCQAGAHAPRGLTWFGWALLLWTFLWIFWRVLMPPSRSPSPHDLMGLLFVMPHLLYGIYLRLTETQP